MATPVQCSSCGYLTYASEGQCKRCGASLAAAQSIGGGTVWGESPRQSTPPPPTPEWTPPTPRPSAPLQQPGFGTPYQQQQPFRAPTRGNPASKIILAVILLGGVGLLGVAYIVSTLGIGKLGGETPQSSLKDLISTQPDFMAECDGVEGDLTFNGRMARKGSNFYIQAMMLRSEVMQDPDYTGKMAVDLIFERGKPVKVVVPDMRVFTELPRGKKDGLDADPIEDAIGLINDPSCTVYEMGKGQVNGYETRMFKLESAGRQPATIEIAPSLKNLIVRIDFGDDWTEYKGQGTYELKNVSFDVDADLFHVPITFTKV